MYGSTRYLYQNLITADMLTVTDQAVGAITGALKNGTGSAVMSLAGAYSGSRNRLYTLQIDDVAGGTGIGGATFSWRNSDTATGLWESSGIATTSELYLLEDNLYVYWLAGGDFALYDFWTWKTFARYLPANLIDYDWHTTYRSLTLASPNVIDIDFGAPTLITAFLLAGHNFTNAATVTLKAGTTPACADYSLSVAYSTFYRAYLSQTYQYWQVTISDAANPASFIEIAHLYLGRYVELTRNPDFGSEIPVRYITQSSATPAGVSNRYIQSKQTTIALKYPLLRAADVTALQMMFAACHDLTTGRIQPMFIDLFSDTAGFIFLVDLPEDFPLTFFRPNLYATNLTLAERVNTR